MVSSQTVNGNHKLIFNSISKSRDKLLKKQRSMPPFTNIFDGYLYKQSKMGIIE